MKYGYIFFHLNLAFSSIPESERPNIINKCYWPILDLVEQECLPIGIELTGWTLQQIAELDSQWVKTFRQLLANKRCELIGSGWTQLIGPLVPSQVNKWNQRLALQAYRDLLHQTPSLVLVNEMAFSASMIETYLSAGYRGMIMDRDNIKLALEGITSDIPSYASDNNHNTLPVLWSDSVLFQRLQRAVHGDITITQYLEYVRQRQQNDQLPLAIYANDAEVFDYRPGRFLTESTTHSEGEWRRFRRILNLLRDESDIEFILPSAAMAKSLPSPASNGRLTSLRYPVPVKKQAKYNLNRWAAAGRDNVWLNTMCHRFYQKLSSDATPTQWQQLCELWASDLRTHITAERWSKLKQHLIQHRIPDENTSTSFSSGSKVQANLKLTKDSENIYWCLETVNAKLTLNMRRGMSIDSLTFKSWHFKPLIVTLPQGYFETIDLAADYYSGGIILELPTKRMRLTDLDWVEPQLSEDNTDFILVTHLKLMEFTLSKTIRLSKVGEKLTISYQIEPGIRPEASVRVGIMTLNMAELSHEATIAFWQGGTKAEVFSLREQCDHSQPVSALVSSTTSIAASQGCILIGDEQNAIAFQWNPAQCAAVPMLVNRQSSERQLTRLLFSLSELDDTFKPGGHLQEFTLSISPAAPMQFAHPPLYHTIEHPKQ